MKRGLILLHLILLPISVLGQNKWSVWTTKNDDSDKSYKSAVYIGELKSKYHSHEQQLLIGLFLDQSGEIYLMYWDQKSNIPLDFEGSVYNYKLRFRSVNGKNINLYASRIDESKKRLYLNKLLLSMDRFLTSIRTMPEVKMTFTFHNIDFFVPLNCKGSMAALHEAYNIL
ncbi:hypothetical protein [Sediminitomix flava]|uniref:Uncharacterized protein n=1 Tax=Sediminitomix flava TaxID=379075 RepID=A0A315ZDI8_SEDFL|nr:hypothetical protein [Sediminitomix flava]PWJ43183.1 hypothetical protein BC781_102732 [Sediminitomix flava]